jgi:hypothetical protein
MSEELTVFYVYTNQPTTTNWRFLSWIVTTILLAFFYGEFSLEDLL